MIYYYVFKLICAMNSIYTEKVGNICQFGTSSNNIHTVQYKINEVMLKVCIFSSVQYVLHCVIYRITLSLIYLNSVVFPSITNGSILSTLVFG